MFRKNAPTCTALFTLLVCAGCGTSGTSTSASSMLSPVTSVQVYETKPDQSALLAAQPSVNFGTGSGSGSFVVQIDPSTLLQPWDGVGAALTDSSAIVLARLSTKQRAAVMQQLFDPTTGIGLNMARVPMGASDMSGSGNYSYDDVAAGQKDLTLAGFSISHDLTNIVPLLQQARAINSNLKIAALPWSPPAWMKTNGSLKGVSGASNTTSQIIPTYYPQLASYFVKFIQAYNAQGLPIYAISAQNEPLYSTSGYPSAILTPVDEATFIASNLGPALKSAGITDTKIFGMEHNYADTAYAQTLLQSNASPFLAGTSFHWYNGTVDQMTTVQNYDTSKGVWFTEFTGSLTCTGTCAPLTATTFTAAGFKYQMQNLVMAIPRNYGRSIIGWNIALDQNLGPQNGGCSNCTGIVTIDSSTSTPSVYLNTGYYVLGHIGKFVTSGARVISTTTQGPTGVNTVGFLNPDGKLILVAFNGGSTSTSMTIAWNSRTFDYTIPAGAAITFSWSSN